MPVELLIKQRAQELIKVRAIADQRQPNASYTLAIPVRIVELRFRRLQVTDRLIIFAPFWIVPDAKST